MRCLWITPQVPFPPFRGGDALYSSNLIRALAEAGAAVTVVCNDNGAEPREVSGIEWVRVPFHDRRRAGSLVSPSPSIVHRYWTRQLREAVEGILRQTVWDAVVIDTLAVAEVFDAALRSGTSTTPLFYVSHNHEESVRMQIARAYRPWSPMRALLTLDAWKAARLERRLVGAADVITTTSPSDAVLFAGETPGKHYVVLTPGFAGDAVLAREINSQTPRRVLLLGSYEWVAKRLNLEAFLSVAAAPLAAANIGIDVVGSIPSPIAMHLQAAFPTARITGVVDDLGPFLNASRIGLVAEAIGGGFKLKVLDYVFSRLPVVALARSVEGTPLVDGQSILLAPDLTEMVSTIIEVIDDYPRLDEIQRAAFHACDGQFDWAPRGEALAAEISAGSA